MFKNSRALSAFVGLVALLFASAVFLATCSSDEPTETRSSGSGRSSTLGASYTPDPLVDVTATNFEVYLTGSKQNDLNVEFTAMVTVEGDDASVFDSVLIKMEVLGTGTSEVLNKTKKRPNDNEGRGFNWDTKDFGKIPVGDDQYCGKRFNVCYYAYVRSNKDPVKSECYNKEEVIRQEDVCRPPSSASAPSSSSAAVSLPLTSVGTVRINQTTGVKLSSGQEAPAADADLTYSPNPANRLVAGPGVKIMQEFRDPECGCFQFTAIATGSCGSVPSPTTTSQFFEPCGSEEAYIDPYMDNQYYLVKTNSATEWSTGWYIVVSSTRSGEAGTAGIELKIWRVN